MTTPAVLLVAAGTPVERELIESWAGTDAPDAERIPATTPALLHRLERDDDPLIVPARVAWLPRERGGDRRVRWSDLLLLTNPRRPRTGAQRRIVRREPDRYRVVVAEPARASELRSRFSTEVGDAGGPEAFAEFVRRQAVLALERAERAVTGDRYKVPRLVAEQILGSARFRTELDRYARRTGRALDEVTTQAAQRLREVVGVQSRLVNDLMAGALSPIHAKAWTPRIGGVDLRRLRELNQKHSLVFLPTHRSYADPLVLHSVLDAEGFPPNHIVGGDNMAFWPLGPLGRRAGMVFIRRSFGDDELYKLAVREYFGYLAAKRFNLEWYIEGGRSRTGKLRAPRFGILQFLVQAIEAGRAEDAWLVPVSITFDLLPEVRAMAAEQGGAVKQREGVGWLARYARSHRQQLGTVHVRFGEPLALRGALRSGALEGADDRRLGVQKVAFEVCHRMNRATPVLPGALVPLALLGAHNRALTLGEVGRVLDPLLDYVAARGLPNAELDELRHPVGISRTLVRLGRAGVVTSYTEGTEPVYAIEPGQHLVAAYYRNNAIHWFVNRAIMEVAALAAGDGTLDAAWEEALKLRDLFKYEFFFAEKPAFREELLAELELMNPGWRDFAHSEQRRRELLGGAPFLAAHRVLRSFAEAYLVVADRLAAHEPRKPVERKAFLQECVLVGRQYVMQRRINSAESVSRELFEGALSLAANRDLVDPGRDELRKRREEFATEVSAVVRTIAAIADLDATRTR